MKNCTFIINVYNDHLLAMELINELFAIYTKPDIIIIFDGKTNTELITLAVQKNVRVVTGSRLKILEFGGEWLIRMFKIFLEYSNKEYLVKIDPDTSARKFHSDLTFGNGVSGVMHTKSFKHPFVLGGIQAFNRATVKRILRSEVLEHQKYTDYKYGYRRFKNPKHLKQGEFIEEDSVLVADFVLGDIIYRLDLQINEWKNLIIKPANKKVLEKDITSDIYFVHPKPGIITLLS